MSQKNKEGWIILMNTIVDGVQPAYRNEDGTPVVYDTEQEAVEELVNDRIEILRVQLEEYKRGEREMEEIDWDPQEWIEWCDIDFDEGKMRITLEDGRMFF